MDERFLSLSRLAAGRQQLCLLLGWPAASPTPSPASAQVASASSADRAGWQFCCVLSGEQSFGEGSLFGLVPMLVVCQGQVIMPTGTKHVTNPLRCQVSLTPALLQAARVKEYAPRLAARLSA